MLKPTNFENIQTGDFVPPAVGGHHMIINGVKEQKSSTGKDMLVVYVDFAPNDSQPGYFRKLYDGDIRPDKKWPKDGVIYVVSLDANGQCSRNFKTFITSFEESNGCQVKWGEGEAFCDQFRGKKIGGVFGRIEEEYNGERHIRTRHRWFCSDAKAESAKAPADKLLPASSTPVTAVPPIDAASGMVKVSLDDQPWF